MGKRPSVVCVQCRTQFYKKPCEIKRCPTHYCSRDCFNKAVRTRAVYTCAKCGKAFEKTPSQAKKSKSGNHFCSRSCSVSFNNALYRRGENHPNWTNGNSSYRARALKEYGSVCKNKLCLFTDVQEEMLDVHHIDGNRENGGVENLVVLCVWCHALLTRELAIKDNFEL